MDRQTAAALLNAHDLDGVQRDIDHALSRRLTLPPRSVIDTGTDVMVQHLRMFLNHLARQEPAAGRSADEHNLMRAAERNLGAAVRPTSQTGHRDAYVYWHTVATLTTGLRDVYLTRHAGQEPPA
ncbi:hypothetical protein ACIPRU_31670 [Streptomyces sp. NPDC090126]|uniref:hypothetical protein n=1 Tax=Streptomyces sp. NPDC090126 TaxID=3365952 RepID=UPI00380D826F